MSDLLAQLKQEIQQVNQAAPAAPLIAITVQIEFKEVFERMIGDYDRNINWYRDSRLPVNFVNRQPEPIRFWRDQESLDRWLRFCETGELVTVARNNGTVVMEIAQYLFQSGHAQVLEWECPVGNRRLTEASRMVLVEALAQNGYEVPDVSLLDFADSVNISLALMIARQRGWGSNLPVAQ
jgi:hypothetical protein